MTNNVIPLFGPKELDPDDVTEEELRRALELYEASQLTAEGYATYTFDLKVTIRTKDYMNKIEIAKQAELFASALDVYLTSQTPWEHYRIEMKGSD